MQPIFIIIWVLTSIALFFYLTRVAIRIQSKNLGLDDLFLGIGGLILVETYIVGTVIIGWVRNLDDAAQRGDLVYLIENAPRLIRYWYSTSATYIFSVWFIKLGIAWFLCRLSNNLIKFGKLRHILFGYIVASFVCVVIIFWASCPPNDFVTETLASSPPKYHRCRWQVQVITPAVFNVVADIVLFIYPFPIIFKANIPSSLRYSLLFVFALCGLVTASAIVRVSLMSSENFLEEGNIYALSWWAGIEGAASLLVASLPVLGGRLISRWRHILTRHSTHRSFTLSRSNNRKSKTTPHTTNSTFSGSKHDMSPKYPPAAFLGTEKTVETVISAGSTLADQRSESSEEEPMSLIQHMARMGRRGSRDVHNHESVAERGNMVTIRKEVYIKEEQREDSKGNTTEEDDNSLDIV